MTADNESVGGWDKHPPDFDSALIAHLRDRIAQLELDAEQCNGALLVAEYERDALRQAGQNLADTFETGLPHFLRRPSEHAALAEWRKLQ